eukprot:m.5410 g.5410  ORF g.5410 m.5410 type:complete len:161 (-) comp3647_c0_seq1:849-1331(-)
MNTTLTLKYSLQAWNLAHEACRLSDAPVAARLLQQLLRLRRLSQSIDPPEQMVAVHLTIAAASIEAAGGITADDPDHIVTINRALESIQSCRESVRRTVAGSNSIAERQLVTFEFKAQAMLGNVQNLKDILRNCMSSTFRPTLGVADFAGQFLKTPSYEF